MQHPRCKTHYAGPRSSCPRGLYVKEEQKTSLISTSGTLSEPSCLRRDQQASLASAVLSCRRKILRDCRCVAVDGHILFHGGRSFHLLQHIRSNKSSAVRLRRRIHAQVQWRQRSILVRLRGCAYAKTECVKLVRILSLLRAGGLCLGLIFVSILFLQPAIS